MRLYDSCGDGYKKLESVDGQVINVEDLDCASYEEFIIALDMYNLIHGGQLSGSGNDLTLQKKITELKKEIVALKRENTQLKQKFNLIGKIFAKTSSKNARKD